MTPKSAFKRQSSQPTPSYGTIFIVIALTLFTVVSVCNFYILHGHDSQHHGSVVEDTSANLKTQSLASAEHTSNTAALETSIAHLRASITSQRDKLSSLESAMNAKERQRLESMLQTKEDQKRKMIKEREEHIHDEDVAAAHQHAQQEVHKDSHTSVSNLIPNSIFGSGSSSSASSSNTDAKSSTVSSPHPPTGDIDSSLPGAHDRRILQMTDEDFKNTPFDQLMASYGEAAGPNNCPGDFGNHLIQRWKATKKTVCNDGGIHKPSTATNIGTSHIDCYLIHQTRHHGNGDNLCHMKDVSVNMGIFGDMNQMYGVVQKYVDSRHFKQPYVPFGKGFIQGQCNVDERAGWDGRKMPGWNIDWTTNAFQYASDATCDEWVEHPVLIVQRDTFANFFHDSEDFVNTFLALAVLGWTPGNTQIYLTDLYPEGPFWPLWNQAFSQHHPTLVAWALKNKYGSNPNHRVCFKDLAVGIYGPAAPVTVASWNTPCSNTALVKAYADYVIRGMGLQSYTHYAQKEPRKVLTITYQSRRPSTVWPEKKFCNDKTSFFLCKLWDSFGIRSLGRMIKNDKKVVEALKGLEKETFKNGARVKLLEADFNLLPFADQIKADLETDIMIGPHGAGLMHNIFMPKRATLIELFIDGSAVNRHFHNLAFWSGHKYVGQPISNPVDIPTVLKLVRKAVEETDINAY